jgi:hypothetical protein
MFPKKRLQLERSQEKEDQSLSKELQFKRCSGPDYCLHWVVRTIVTDIKANFQIIQRDEKAREKAPEVIKQDIDNPAPDKQNAAAVTNDDGLENMTLHELVKELSMTGISSNSTENSKPGHLFPLPDLPLPSGMHLKHRYDGVVEQLTNLLMKDGKKSVAQRAS